MSNLKPCPFCNEQDTHSAECYFTLLARSMQYNHNYPYTGKMVNPTQEEIDKAWNTRKRESRVVKDAAEFSKTHYYAGNERACSYPNLLIYAKELEKGENY